MALNDVINNLYVGLAGDRVDLIAKIGAAGCISAAAISNSGLWVVPLPFFAGLIGYTKLGLSTLKYYKRTSAHIKKFGRLDRRFAETLIKGTENRKFTGYCQLQGLYLAAKRYGQLDVFYAAKSAVSNNVLPNF